MGFNDGSYEFYVGGRYLVAGQNSDEAKDMMVGWGYLLVMGLIQAEDPKQFRVTDHGYQAAARIRGSV